MVGLDLSVLPITCLKLFFVIPEKIAVTIEDVYDMELQLSLQKLYNAGSKEEAIQVINSTSLLSVLDLAGTLQPIQSTDDIRKIAEMTAKWFVIGRT